MKTTRFQIIIFKLSNEQKGLICTSHPDQKQFLKMKYITEVQHFVWCFKILIHFFKNIIWS